MPCWLVVCRFGVAEDEHDAVKPLSQRDSTILLGFNYPGKVVYLCQSDIVIVSFCGMSILT